jgi:Domain of unknown function (DUF6457)
MTTSARDWIERYAAALGVAAPTEEEVAALLDAAGVASHASERTAAPVSCWLAATAGVTPTEALAAAERVAASLPETT